MSVSPIAAALAELKKKTTIDLGDIIVPGSPDLVRVTHPYISTNSIALDTLIGGTPNKYGIVPCPGWPRGKVGQLYGKPSAGKTTAAGELCASVCSMGGTAVYVDLEHEVDQMYFESLGVPIDDPERFVLVQPTTVEEGLKIMTAFIRAKVDVIIVDSVAAGVPEKYLNQDLREVGDNQRLGLIAAIWSQELPKFKVLVKKSGTFLLGIAQLRKAIKTGPNKAGDDNTQQGGEAWKFYSSVRMMLTPIEKITSDNEIDALTGKKVKKVIGQKVLASLDKCKVSSNAHHKTVFYLMHGIGFDDLSTILEVAKNHRIAALKVTSGGRYEAMNDQGETVQLHGKPELQRHYDANPAAYRVLEAQVRAKLTTPYSAGEIVVDDEGNEYETDVDGNDNDLSDMESMTVEQALEGLGDDDE